MVIALAVLPLVPLSPAAASDEPVLIGSVGPGFTIDLKDANGDRVLTLVPGRYHLIVHDLSSEHNFVMADEPAGQKFVIQTEVPFVGDASFDLDLTPGGYAFACAPHFQIMNGRFTVVAPPPPPPKKLSGAVTAARPGDPDAAQRRRRVPPAHRARPLEGAGLPSRRRRGAADDRAQVRRRQDLDVSAQAGHLPFGTDRRLTGRLVVS